MKLMILLTLIIKYTEGAHDQFSFPPQFQKPNAGDNSIFLPPEAYTPVPHFPIKNMNNLPYPYLPPTGTKAPTMFPSPFPVILSSTLVPIFDDDDDEVEKESSQTNNKIRISSPLPHMLQTKPNNTDSDRIPQAVKREMRATPKMTNHQNPIDRIDMRMPTQFSLGPTTPNSMGQAARNMIIDTHRHDFGIDHIKSGSNQNPHYIAAPGFSISSTTEPAIPIIRLSNEMDLDGSFSYEALGADQTHYVQHSHMENMGTDKQEQVVEGSYSYVGDNGQTYTVHYIADSNGFRASGDHLPVAPPIPEIIQRAVQYNLAEEAKKPPHLRDWQESDRDSDFNEKGQYYPVPQPTRSLFTGRTPEAFSYGFSQGSSHENNFIGASSSQIPAKTNPDFIIDQTRPKPNNGPIAPQITFVASQGAHVPASNQPAPQQSISRVFGSEKAMPQLVNYEVGHKDIEQDGNRGLWRWQYGLNSNNLSQTPEKNSISRSFGEGDDIMINFGDMTQEQYTKMLQSQFEPQHKQTEIEEPLNVYSVNNQNRPSEIKYDAQNYPEMNYYSTVTNNVQSNPTTVSSLKTSSTQRPPQQHNALPYTNEDRDDYNKYDYNKETLYANQDTPYEFRRIKGLKKGYISKPNNYNINTIPTQNENKSSYNFWPHKNIEQNEHNVPIVSTSTVSTSELLRAAEFKTDFKPIIKLINEEKQETTSIVADTTTENMFKSNLFLKSLIEPKKPSPQNFNKNIVDETKKTTQNHILDERKHYSLQKLDAEPKADKQPKYFSLPLKQFNDFKTIRSKPADISEVINYITNKNVFESSKITPKINTLHFNGYDQRNEMRTYPYYDEDSKDDTDYSVHKQTSNIHGKTNTVPEREELRGIIKNYKVLQRNNNLNNKNNEQNHHNRKEVTPLRPLQSGLPPLGRAGPSMKSYLPPIYV